MENRNLVEKPSIIETAGLVAEIVFLASTFAVEAARKHIIQRLRAEPQENEVSSQRVFWGHY
ncbi:MAG: hypothetical protein WCJ24_01915 [Candidatus Saccharibacteria bacterium]